MSFNGAVAGSFRDPAGYVHDVGGKIYRTITPAGAEKFEKVVATGFLDRLVTEGRLVAFAMVDDPEIRAKFPKASHILAHPRLDFISYPYEWSFSQLKAAALHHLDLAIDALAAGLTLSDATAYNIQFVGAHPIFIDHLSFKPYRTGQYWTAHSQFCEQFLNPLLLRSEIGIAHNSWFRGSLEGIPTDHMSRLLPLRARLSLRMNAHVFLPAHFQKGTHGDAVRQSKGSKPRKGLPLRAYDGLLRQLRKWIAALEPKGQSKTVWGDYAESNTYDNSEISAKAGVIEDFVSTTAPKRLIDLGCNSGFFSETALTAGAQSVVGFDFDQTALDKAYQRSLENSLSFIPLFLDAANPSPSQGWSQSERYGFAHRAQADAVIALAFEHHLAIGKNVPLNLVIDWITSIAPTGIIEFVPKSDPTVQAMLSMREDIFANYTEENFANAIARCAEIVNSTKVTGTGRTLYQFKKS